LRANRQQDVDAHEAYYDRFEKWLRAWLDRDAPASADPHALHPPGEGMLPPGVPDPLHSESPGRETDLDSGGLTFLPGALLYRGHRQELSGYPLAILQALYQAPGQTLTLRAILDKVWGDNMVGEETVRSHISTARNALREVLQAAGVEDPADPLPCVDRGTGRTAWRLDLP
jgi:DNA-binding response OmpR family regulator